MKTILKLLFATFGFAIAVAASSNYAKADILIAYNGECHGSGTCFVTAGGTTINGQWCEYTY